MTSPTRLLLTTLICFGLFAGHSQPADWKPLQYGKISLKYPPTWIIKKESHEGHSRIDLTPDSMRNLSMHLIEVYELPVGGEHNYAFFKENFSLIINPQKDESAKILKIEEISFKGHKTMYAEIIRSSLPAKIYGINAGSAIYLFAFLQRRYIKIPDPKIERDEKAILNSITIHE